MNDVTVYGVIMTRHVDARVVGGAIRPDNLASMTTGVSGGCVRTVIRSHNIRSVIASIDDYLMNLGIAEDICSYALH